MAVVYVVSLLLVVASLVQGSFYSRTVSYENDVVIKCNDKNDKRVKILMEYKEVDVWRVYPTGQVDMRMSQQTYAIVLHYMPEMCSIIIDNVEAHVQMAEENMLSEKQKLKSWINNWFDPVTLQEEEIDTVDDNWFNEYHNFDSIQNWYRNMARQYPNLIQYVSSIGKSSEQRDISAVHITASDDPNRFRFYIQCLIHAREWISGCVCMYQTKILVEGYGHDETITNLVNSMEFIIIPVVNPDGYVYTWNTDRIWRKNRVITSSDDKCVGVDLNRNFPSGWNMGNSHRENDKDKCSETYSGSDAASELETKHIINYFSQMSPIVGAIDFHAFGQLILRPWGCQYVNSIDEHVLSELGNTLARLIFEVHGHEYTSQTSHELYQACGVASDWFYSNKVTTTNKGYRTASYTIELRDDGKYQFILPAEQILSTCEEVNPAVLHLAQHILQNPLKD